MKLAAMTEQEREELVTKRKAACPPNIETCDIAHIEEDVPQRRLLRQQCRGGYRSIAREENCSRANGDTRSLSSIGTAALNNVSTGRRSE